MSAQGSRKAPSASLLSALTSFPASVAPSDLRTYLNHIMKSTNMSCLTPEAALSGECDFLSANMYARSLFGEYLMHLDRIRG
jgi:vesicle coat complex subunit